MKTTTINKLSIVLLATLIWSRSDTWAQISVTFREQTNVWAKGSPPGPNNTEPNCANVQVKLWTDTGIRVTNTEIVRFRAWGTWAAGTGGSCGPDGYLNGSFDPAACFLQDDDHGNLLQPFPRGALLLGFVGSDPHCGNPNGACPTSSYFAVGSERFFKSSADGELWLGFNDDASIPPYDICDNSGFVTVRIDDVTNVACQTFLDMGRLSRNDSSADSFSFRITGAPSANCTVQQSLDLQTWSTAGTLALNSWGVAFFTDSNCGLPNQKFYRVIVNGCCSSILGFYVVSIPAGQSRLIANQFADAFNLNFLFNPMPAFFNGSPATLPPDTMVAMNWNGSAFANTYSWDGTAWSPDGNGVIQPGSGAWVTAPPSAPATLVLVGIVPTGTLANSIQTGTRPYSSMVPQSGGLVSLLQYPPASGDSIRLNDGVTYTYNGSWTPTEPAPKVGDAFWLTTATARTWTRSFVPACPGTPGSPPPANNLKITTQPASQTVCSGSTATFSVQAFSCSDLPISYQWQKNNVNLTDGGNISGAQTSTLYISPASVADQGTYTVIVSQTGESITSDPATLLVDTQPVITQQPAPRDACVGNTVTFTVQATGPRLQYQWFNNSGMLADGPTGFGSAISGSKTSTLTISGVTLSDANYYYVEVYNACATYSDSVPLTVHAGAPTISAQPSASPNPACPGDSVSFSISANDAVTYQWKLNGVNVIDDGVRIFGAQTASLYISPVNLGDAGTYTVLLGNACGTRLSSGVSLLIPEPPTIVVQPKPQRVCNNSTALFRVVAQGSSLSYKWYKNGALLSDSSHISGSQTATLRIFNATSADQDWYNVEILNTCGDILSDSVYLTVDNDVPSITTQPLSQTVDAGSSVSFSVSWSGTASPDFQWKKDGINLSDIPGYITGANSPNLNLAGVTLQDAGTYSVQVSSGCGTVTSSGAVLTVHDPCLLAWWTFDQDSGNVAVDSSGNGDDATIVGPATHVPGIYSGSALQLDGASAYADISAAGNLNFDANSEFTIAGWFKTTTEYGTIFSLRDDAPGGMPVLDVCVGFDGASDSPGQLMALLRTDTAAGWGDLVEIVGPSVNDGVWHHFAITRQSDGTFELFLDGLSQGTGSSGSSAGSLTTNLRALGAELRWIQDFTGDPSMQYFNGPLDDMRIYHCALTPLTISRMAGLLAYWKMDEQSGNTLADSAGNANDATLQALNNATFAHVPGMFDYALSLTPDPSGHGGAYADYGSGYKLNFAANQAFTITGWFKTTASYGVILSQRNDYGNGAAVVDICIGQDGATQSPGHLMAIIRNDAWTVQQEVIGALVNDGQWHSFAVVRQTDGSLELLKDGQWQAESHNAGGAQSITTDFRAIGSERRWVMDGAFPNAQRYFNGLIDDVRVYDHSLANPQ